VAIRKIHDFGEWHNYEEADESITVDGSVTFQDISRYCRRFPPDWWVWVVAEGQVSVRYSHSVRDGEDPDSLWRTLLPPTRIASLRKYGTAFVRNWNNWYSEVYRVHIHVTEVWPR
jgi:hypothetical protein